MTNHYLLAIDLGTSSTRAIIFDGQGAQVAQAQTEFTQYYPEPGWVEHDADEIWQKTLSVIEGAIANAKLSAKDILACGITNQRETTVLWDTQTGEPVHKAIVWQDKRSTRFCQLLQKDGHAKEVHIKTGLTLDPYFSASKVRWLLKNIPLTRELLLKERLAFGTIDSFILWRLTKGRKHATDPTNASRTSLFNIVDLQWDDALLSLFEVPVQIMPEVLPSNSNFGEIDATYFGAAIPITGIIGDQQAASLGQACIDEGAIKSTYGTGCFLLLNTGKHLVHSDKGLLSTIALQIDSQTHYALEGSIFNAGRVIKWVRDNLGLIKDSKESSSLAASVEDNGGVYFVPAFSGLGAPYWDPDARALISGLSLGSGRAQIVRAALEAVCYQTKTIVDCMQKISQTDITQLRVDGGMVANDWLMQFLADLLNCEIERPQIIETTALGAAMMAGLGCGYFPDLTHVTKFRQRDKLFTPALGVDKRDGLYAGWLQALNRARSARVT
jgi:glycerol kinase